MSVDAEPVYAVAWNPVSEALVSTGGGDDRAYLWQVGSSLLIQYLRLDCCVVSLRVVDNGRLVLLSVR